MENNTISGGNSKIDTSLEAPQRVAVTSSVMISRETLVKNRRGEGRTGVIHVHFVYGQLIVDWWRRRRGFVVQK